MSKRWRGSRAARASPDDVHIRQAVACRVLPPGHGQRSAAGGIVRHGLGLALTIRERQGQGLLTPCPPRIRKAARHRPVSTLTLTAGRRWPDTRGEDLSGGWLGRSSRQGVPQGHPVQADPAASGTRRCTASSIVPPHVTADTRRPSSRLDRHVDDPSGDGSTRMMAWEVEGGEKIAG
jgi:hypothetical protein